MEREISHHLSIFVLAHACGLLEDFTKEEINRKIQNSFGIIHPHFYVQETPTKKKEPGGIIWFLQTKFTDGEMSTISDQTWAKITQILLYFTQLDSYFDSSVHTSCQLYEIHCHSHHVSLNNAQSYQQVTGVIQ